MFGLSEEGTGRLGKDTICNSEVLTKILQCLKVKGQVFFSG